MVHIWCSKKLHFLNKKRNFWACVAFEKGLQTYLDRHCMARGPVNSSIDDAELARPENFVQEYLIRLRNLLLLSVSDGDVGWVWIGRLDDGRGTALDVSVGWGLDRHQGLPDGVLPQPSNVHSNSGVDFGVVGIFTDKVVHVSRPDLKAVLRIVTLFDRFHRQDLRQWDFFVVICSCVTLKGDKT